MDNFSIITTSDRSLDDNAHAPTLHYIRAIALCGENFDLLTYATSPMEAAQQLVDYYELEEAADLEGSVLVAVVPTRIPGIAGPISWDFLDGGTHIEPSALTYRGLIDDEDEDNET